MKKWIKSMITIVGVAIMTLGAAGVVQPQTANARTFPLFVDVSSWNPDSPQFFRNAAAHGVKGAAVKITESNWYHNPLAAAQIRNARAAGLAVSVYHYAQFTNTAQAAAEARFFAARAQQLGMSKATMMIVDVEEQHTLNNNSVATVTAFQSTLASLGYNNQSTYASQSYFLAGKLPRKYPIWVARYGNYTMPGVDNADAWQFTSQYNVNGTLVDMSYDFFGKFTTTPVEKPAAPKPTTPAPKPSTPAPAPKPSTPAQKPSAPAQKPSTPAQKPSAPAQKPSTPAQKPSAPAQKPSTPAQKPSMPAPTQKPSAPAPKPSTPAPAPKPQPTPAPKPQPAPTPAPKPQPAPAPAPKQGDQKTMGALAGDQPAKTANSQDGTAGKTNNGQVGANSSAASAPSATKKVITTTTKKTLPQTGETVSVIAIALGGMLVALSGLAWVKLRRQH